MSDIAASLQTPEQYRAERTHVYPSAESLKWFVRKNRAQLVEAGALLKPTGRVLVKPDAFDRAVVDIGLRRARREPR